MAYLSDVPRTPDEVRNALTAHDYLVDDGIATAVFLALTLNRPLLLEGEAGVGPEAPGEDQLARRAI